MCPVPQSPRARTYWGWGTVPRGERPLDDGDGPLLRFAADLRKLRTLAGSPVYRELSRRAHYSTAVLSEAAGGRKLPSLAVTLAYVTACEGDSAQWERRWREVAAQLTPIETPGPTRSPYLGAAAFDVGDADRFFGRDALVDELATAVGEHRLVLVHGSSGSGKSSLLRAGLAARRRAVVFTPGMHPIEECAVRLAVVAGWSAPRLRDELAADPANLHLRVRQAAADGELLLVVDQFEEVLAAGVDETERRTFIAALVHAAAAETSRCRIVLSVRADFLDRCAKELPDVHQFAMRAMTTDELREAATKPALVAGSTLETALVARVIADASAFGATLPLVSTALLETWHRRQGMTLTLAGYDEAGGIRHAIARTAESVYLAFEPAERDLARQIFLRLTAFGDGAEDTKRRIDRCELHDGPQTAAVLGELVRSRLVTVGRHTIELTHEALLVTWARLRDWLSEDRDGLRTHRQLTEAAAAWVVLDRDSGALYRGLRLLIAEDWISRAKPVLSGRERTFFTASLYAERERRRFDRKRTRRLRQLVALLVVLLGITAFTGVSAWVQGQEELRQQVVQDVVARVPALMPTNQYLAGQLALAAHRLAPDSPPATGRLLQFAVVRYTVPGGRGDAKRIVAVDSKGTFMASGGSDGAIALTDLGSGADIDIPGFGAAVDSLAWSADEKLLAASYDDGTLAVFDVSARDRPAQTWTRHGNRVLVSFSRTGRTLAAGGHPVDNIVGDRLLAPVDQDTTLWDATDPHTLAVVGHLPQALGPVQFSADGQTVTALPVQGGARQPAVWHQADGVWAAIPAAADELGDYVAESISDDGSLVTAVSNALRAPAITLWQIRDGRLVKTGAVSSTPYRVAPAFDDANDLVALEEADGTVVVWRLGPGAPSKQIDLVAAAGDAQALFFQPNGALVVVGATTVSVWAMNPDTAATAVCKLPRSGLVSQAQWDAYFSGMEVPMPCEQ